ncbi:Hypothetical protein GbCGDNIH3_7009 [Granulibacter bethesdensis]|uniref:Uncharacterized protein n=1 Tax=Granulibacter bethesdensis TaxID=364410 RepID=A0AAN0REI0_9PROT|nr:Hypothetical protein GbCGDNIH3_7009 [Granulibacter bethesdensis]
MQGGVHAVKGGFGCWHGIVLFSVSPPASAESDDGCFFLSVFMAMNGPFLIAAPDGCGAVRCSQLQHVGRCHHPWRESCHRFFHFSVIL